MANEDRTCFLACNGEIYNHRALREELIGRGHRFRSQSDSEVVLHLIEEQGVAGARRLNGMFAFAFLDTRRGILLLCRDPLGIKPLYYAGAGPGIVFASEIKALFRHPAVRPLMDRRRLQEMLQCRYVGGEATFFLGVAELQPGQAVFWDLKTLRKKSCDFSDVLSDRPGRGSEVTPALIRENLAEAVERQLMSDVPLGVQISGGLDSALVTALAVRRRDAPTHSFSVGFVGAREDESPWARLVSERLGTIHHSISCTQRDFLGDLARCTFLNDDPIGHPNSVPIYRMCQAARRHVTVLLTGEGADELFGGYSWHRRLWRLSRLGRLAGIRAWRTVSALSAALPPVARIAPLLGKEPREMATQSGLWMTEGVFKRIAHPALPEQAPLYRDAAQVPGDDPLTIALALDLRTYLLSVLRRQDRMSMAEGVEARVPFLDLEFVRVARLVSGGDLFAGGRGKDILRAAAQGLVPPEILERAKIGFRVPIHAWMRGGDGLARLLEWIGGERAAERCLWQIAPVRAMVAAHRAGHANWADALWSLLAVELWARIWLDGTSPEDLREAILRDAGMEVPAARGIGAETVGERARPRGAACAASLRPLRICHVVPSLETGGMERIVCDLIGGMDARGHVCQVFCTDAEGDLFDGVCARARLCVPRRPGLLLVNSHVVRRLAAFIREHGADVVHAHNHVAHLYAVPAAALAGKPVVVTLHGQGYYDTPRVRLMRRLLMLGTRRAIGVSRDIRDRFVGMRVAPAGKFRIVANAVQPARFSTARGPDARATARARLGVPAGAFVVGSVGRLAPEKNYPLLVRAFAELLKKGSGVRCPVSGGEEEVEGGGGRVAGGGEEKIECRASFAQGASAFARPTADRSKDKMSNHECRREERENVECGTWNVESGGEERARSPTSHVQHSSFKGQNLKLGQHPASSSASPPSTLHPPPSVPTPPRAETPVLLLVGDGPEREKIEAAANELGIRDRVILPGMRDDVIPWLACMDAFCLPSLTEGTSLTLLEAGAAELPLVATDVGGNGEIVEDGVSGFLVPSGDAVALASALGRLCREPGLRARMGQAARCRVEKDFSLETMIGRYEWLYREILHQIPAWSFNESGREGIEPRSHM